MSSTTLRRLIVISLIVLWEVLPRIGAIPELFLPSLSSTLQAGWNEAGEYGHALAVTLYEVAAGMVIAARALAGLGQVTFEAQVRYIEQGFRGAELRDARIRLAPLSGAVLAALDGSAG